MAIICIACFPKRSVNIILLRLLNRTYCEKKLIQSSPESLINSKNAPVKFTTSKASTISIAETTGLQNENKRSRFVTHIVLGSLAVLLVYFGLLREENDIDEILKGNAPESDSIKILNLKIQLQYCEKNGLPTEPLKSKIQELENKLQQSSHSFQIK